MSLPVPAGEAGAGLLELMATSRHRKTRDPAPLPQTIPAGDARADLDPGPRSRTPTLTGSCAISDCFRRSLPEPPLTGVLFDALEQNTRGTPQGAVTCGDAWSPVVTVLHAGPVCLPTTGPGGVVLAGVRG